MTDRIALAAHNNALWCDVVCRSHGLAPRMDAVAWSSPTRTPPFHPDAITLSPRTREHDVLDRIDSSPGASVKDCWSALDLAAAHFVPVIEGEWVWLDPTVPSCAPSGHAWATVTSTEGLASWVAAWSTHPEGVEVLLPAILGRPGVHVLAARARTAGDGPPVAGAIVNVTGGVAGVSNVFSVDADEERAWAGAAAFARDVVGGIPLVGWETGTGLDAAVAVGCETIGPLRVWLR